MEPSDQLREIQERLWVIGAQQQEQAAFHQLVDCYQRRLLYYVRRIIGDEQRTLEVVQDVWLTVFRRIASLRSPDAFRVWLYQIAHNQAVTLVRRERLEAGALEEISDDQTEVDSSNELTLLENAELVHRALEQLSVIHREVLTLRFLEDLSVEAIADITGANEATTRSRLHQAKRVLRRKVEELSHDKIPHS